ncbi:single-pass membrane and coiled-coil domain-containing protein 3-like [Sinocyclocheilus rhinocerous]|uniref:Single-pass membrane and coiled-coil domain-containing protein 3-like n=1 Tax=Sinocyclocheilus rhinocerous TaxID=307959 RepID=A0A673L0C2_9TELE|nr:PREDICTED: single-pass membrane and coiled-coil domain-containing protein 3-like [Sinocyclocheilus rhinocerous]
MSLGDVLYPGNPERRENVIRRSQELIDLMKSNFEATNSLIEIVNEHLHSSFSPITLNKNATVKENCDVMIERVNQIQAKVEEVDEKLKKELEPTVYEKLQHMSLKDFNKLSAVVKVAIKSVCQIAAAVIVKYLMKNIIILTNITSTCAKVAVGTFASIVLGVLIDVIVSAIVGHVERANLESALAEYEEALKTFRPASKEYEMAIYEVMFMLKHMKKK